MSQLYLSLLCLLIVSTFVCSQSLPSTTKSNENLESPKTNLENNTDNPMSQNYNQIKNILRGLDKFIAINHRIRFGRSIIAQNGVFEGITSIRKLLKKSSDDFIATHIADYSDNQLKELLR